MGPWARRPMGPWAQRPMGRKAHGPCLSSRCHHYAWQQNMPCRFWNISGDENKRSLGCPSHRGPLFKGGSRGEVGFKGGSRGVPGWRLRDAFGANCRPWLAGAGPPVADAGPLVAGAAGRGFKGGDCVTHLRHAVLRDWRAVRSCMRAVLALDTTILAGNKTCLAVLSISGDETRET